MLALFTLNKFFGIPPLCSENGEMVDNMLEIVHWFMTILFVGWSIFFVWVMYRYNKVRHPKADYRGVRGHATTHIEIGVIIVEAILLLGFAFPLWAQQSKDYPTGPNVLKMRAVGEKFNWNFQYPGLDGVLGRQHIKLVDNGHGNPIGRDMKDPNGKDDFVKAGEMTVPLGRSVIVDITSKDVIHSLALTPMRMTQDATPGVNGQIWFKPTKIGSWPIICAQLCGPGHSGMKATLTVVKPDEFDTFVKDNSAAPASPAAAAPATPAPAPAAPATPVPAAK